METLSDWIMHGRVECIGGELGVNHVKEFIKKLKEQLDIYYGKSEGNKKFMLGLNHAKEIIDELAGDELI